MFVESLLPGKMLIIIYCLCYCLTCFLFGALKTIQELVCLLLCLSIFLLMLNHVDSKCYLLCQANPAFDKPHSMKMLLQHEIDYLILDVDVLCGLS